MNTFKKGGLVLVLGLLTAGCGASAPAAVDEGEASLAQAMCNDLEDGLSMFQMHAQAVEYYRGTGRSEDAAQLASAELEDLATTEYCPEFRDEFEATITYEQWIAD